MTPRSDASTTIAPSRRGRRGRRPAHVTRSALTAILALWLLLFAAGASVAAAAVTGSPGSAFGQRSSGRLNAVAHTSAAGEAEGEEEVAEETEGEEAAASAEAEEEEGEAAVAGSPASGSSGTDAVVLSKLKLTAQAGTALRRPEPAISAVGFSFTLSASARVHVTLVKQTRVEGHTRWVTLPDSLTLTAARGQDHSSLKGHNRLSPGRYRLTVRPAAGHSRSIYLSAQP